VKCGFDSDCVASTAQGSTFSHSARTHLKYSDLLNMVEELLRAHHYYETIAFIEPQSNKGSSGSLHRAESGSGRLGRTLPSTHTTPSATLRPPPAPQDAMLSCDHLFKTFPL
jgi:hypothetical protein